MTLPAGVHGCETWPLTLREEHRLRMSQNRVPREIPGSKRGKCNKGMENTVLWAAS
jgi:hypothetical protein